MTVSADNDTFSWDETELRFNTINDGFAEGIDMVVQLGMKHKHPIYFKLAVCMFAP